MSEPFHQVTKNFAAFFNRINPSLTYERVAARAHPQITSLIEDTNGPAAELRINTFLQGSYKRNTAIHSINDVDVVALCNLSYTPSASRNTRDQIFTMIADSIAKNKTYKEKLRYHKQSVCVKVLLEGIRIEILPALKTAGMPFEYEPIFMFRPDEDEIGDGEWQTTFARKHQELCTKKNSETSGLFIPMIKVLKHLRFVDSNLNEQDAISFHIEGLLFALKKSVYGGVSSVCIESVLKALAGFTSEKAAVSQLKTPCGDNQLFGSKQWSVSAYDRFNDSVTRWYELAARANRERDRDKAIDIWKQLLGDDYFPRDPQ